MRFLILTFCSVLFLAMSCKSDQTTSVDETTKIIPAEVKDAAYKLTPFSSSPEFQDASLSDMTFIDKGFEFQVAGTSYELGTQTIDAPTKMCVNSAKGQHIHLIVDNSPYAAKYTSSFDYEIADGEHYILAFLSRSYHESIKTKSANILSKVQAKNNSIESSEAVADEMVFYSRPKGTYVGDDTKKVMLDFYLSNTEIAKEGNKVIADINGQTHVISTWQPYYIEGLPMGENTITLTLVDEANKKIESPLNPVTRIFTLQADPTPTK